MAILPILEREDVKTILLLIQKENKITAPELNDKLVQGGKITSSSGLYRRLKELLMADILQKVDSYYSLTNYGTKIFQQFQEHEQVSFKEREILTKFSQAQSSSDIQRMMSISPNTLTKNIKNLVKQDLIEQVEEDDKTSKRSKPGRKKKKYKLTKKGEKVAEDTKKLKRKAKKR